jgi:nucleoside-diphosphate-sugar epimerase
MRILVTGGAGFIGSALTHFLFGKNYEVVTLDGLLDSTYSSAIKLDRWLEMQKILKDVEFVQANLTQELQLNKIPTVDVIVHLAAIPGLDLSWRNLQSYTDNNIIATKNVIELANKFNAKLIHISTSSVYGGIADGNENQACSPISPYGVTKLAAENLIIAYAKVTNLSFTILRFFSIYGPGQRPDMGYETFIHSILSGKKISIYGDGTSKRSSTYVGDCLEATEMSLLKPAQLGPINIAGKELISVNDVLLSMASLIERKPKIEFLNRRNGDQSFTSGNTAKAEKHLGWESRTSFLSGIREQIEICKSGDCQKLAFKSF